MNCPLHSSSPVHKEMLQEDTTLEAIKVLAPYFLKALRKNISQQGTSSLSLHDIVQSTVESEDEMRAEISQKYTDIPFRGNTLTHIPAPSCLEEEILQKYHTDGKLHGKRTFGHSFPDLAVGTSFLFRLFYVIESLLQKQGKVSDIAQVIHHPKTLAFLNRYMTIGKQRLSPIMGELYGLSGVEEFEFEHIYTPLEERFFSIGQDSRGNFLTEDELLQGIRQRIGEKTKTGTLSACPVFGTTMFSDLYEALFEVYLTARNIKNPSFPS